MQGYLVAFAGRPKDSASFLDVIRTLSKNDGVDIRGAILTTGPGCYNLAFLLEEPNERFAEALTMALMPAKYSHTTDPRLKEGEFLTEM